MLFWFREPQLHKTEERDSLRGQIRATYRMVLGGGHLRTIVALTVVELFLCRGCSSSVRCGWSRCSSHRSYTGRIGRASRPRSGLAGCWGHAHGSRARGRCGSSRVAVLACCVALVVSEHAVLVIGVQVALTLLVVAVSIPVMRRLHDTVPSTIRAGVASGVGTLTWLAFVPFARRLRDRQPGRRTGPRCVALRRRRRDNRHIDARRTAARSPGGGGGGRRRSSSRRTVLGDPAGIPT